MVPPEAARVVRLIGAPTDIGAGDRLVTGRLLGGLLRHDTAADEGLLAPVGFLLLCQNGPRLRQVGVRPLDVGLGDLESGAGFGDLGLLLAPHLTLASYGCWGEYVLGGETLGAVLARGAASIGYHSRGDRLILSAEGGVARVAYHSAARGRPGYAHVALGAAGVIVNLCRACAPPGWRPLGLDLDLPRPASAARFEEAFGCRVRFDAPFTAPAALHRNTLLYGMSDLTIAIGPRRGEGGTWHGAVSALRRRLGPVAVWLDEAPGVPALLALGAKPLPSVEALSALLASVPEGSVGGLFQGRGSTRWVS